MALPQTPSNLPGRQGWLPLKEEDSCALAATVDSAAGFPFSQPAEKCT